LIDRNLMNIAEKNVTNPWAWWKITQQSSVRSCRLKQKLVQERH
jgi:hypothetical protein